MLIGSILFIGVSSLWGTFYSSFEYTYMKTASEYTKK